MSELDVPHNGSESASRLLLGRFLEEFLSKTTRFLSASATINEVRVALRVHQRHQEGLTVSVTVLARELGMPKATVSRVITSLMARKYLGERIDPTDRRRRQLIPTDGAASFVAIWEAWMDQWLEQLQEHSADRPVELSSTD